MSEAKAREHLERALAWLTDIESDNEPDENRMGAARAEIRAYLAAVPAPPAEPTYEEAGSWPNATRRFAANAAEPVAQQPPPRRCPHTRAECTYRPSQWCASCPRWKEHDDAVTTWAAAQQPESPTLADDELVARARELAEYKYQHHTIHVPVVLRALADRIEFDAKRIRELEAENARRSARNAEVSMLAYRWMEAHDALKAGEPYELPKPADLPEAIVASRERERALRVNLRMFAIDKFSTGARCGICKGSWAYDRPEGEWHEAGCLATPDSAASPTGGEG